MQIKVVFLLFYSPNIPYNQSFEEGKSCCKILSQTQQCVCATDLCNKDFETAAPPKGDNDDDYHDDETTKCRTW